MFPETWQNHPTEALRKMTLSNQLRCVICLVNMDLNCSKCKHCEFKV